MAAPVVDWWEKENVMPFEDFQAVTIDFEQAHRKALEEQLRMLQALVDIERFATEEANGVGNGRTIASILERCEYGIGRKNMLLRR